MIANLFLTLTDYPVFRRLAWKPIYEALAKNFRTEKWHFMNYGYAPSEGEPPLTLEEGEEMNRFSIQLYHYLALKAPISGSEVLEVGCGRGGGASHIKKYLSPKKMIGLDIAHNAIKLCNDNHAEDGLSYMQGSAEAIPFHDESFDVVINVESCHAYGSVPKFLSEVKRVLRPGGYFLCTDIRSPHGMNTLKTNLIDSKLQLIEEDDITDNVRKAIEMEEPIKVKRIEKNIPQWLQGMFKEFAGVEGSKIHEDLKARTLIYHRFLLKK